MPFETDTFFSVLKLSIRRGRLLPGCLLLAVMVLALWPYAQAQIMKTARAELNSEKQTVYIGQDLYVTKDPEGLLTPQAVIDKHQNNLRGDRQNGKIINLGPTSAPAWAVFSVTNDTPLENWILYFGNVFDGRYAPVRNISVRNAETGEIYTSSAHEITAPKIAPEDLQGAAVPITITAGKTELFVVFLQTAGGWADTIAPSLMAPQTYFSKLRFGDMRTAVAYVILISLASFFISIAYLQKDWDHLPFAAYYLLHAALLYTINAVFFTTFTLSGDLPGLILAAIALTGILSSRMFLQIGFENHSENTALLGLASFVIVTALLGSTFISDQSVLQDLLFFVPPALVMLALAGLSFVQAQTGVFAGYYLAIGWLIGFLGLAISALSAVNIIGTNGFALNAFWLFLLPQAGFFVAGTKKRLQIQQEEQRNLQARESRAAQSLARLKQSKESADQTRLLRVIERERELMAELREREMQRTEEMRRAKEMADEANRAKSAFLAVVSHEIRTPMTGIMGVIRLLKDTKMSKDQTDYMMAIQKSGDTMMALLNDILDFEKIETGKMEIEIIDFDLPKLVQGVVTLMSGHAADKGIYLKSEIAEGLPRYLKGDPTRLRQMLLNLVSNAMKFTEKGGVTVRLKSTKVDKSPDGAQGDFEIYFAVEDTGIGISDEAQRNLFNPFQQADKTVSRRYGGSGLGLAICQRLIEAMGGAIRLTSTQGQGSTFYFSLMMDEGTHDATDDIDDAAFRHLPINIPSMRILIIEDNEINRKVLQNFLEKDGHQVTVAERGERAVEICNEKIFDVIFTDIRLPGMSGIETARTIRTLPDKKIARTPIFAITGNVAEDDLQECRDAGINDCLSKPIDYDRLLRTLSDVHAGRYNIEVTVKPAPKENASDDEDAYTKNLDSAPIHRYLDEEKKQAEAIKPIIPSPPPKTDPTPDITKPVLKMAPLQMPPPEALVGMRFEDDEAAERPETPAVPEADVLDRKMAENLHSSLGLKQISTLMEGFIEKTDEITAQLQQLAEKPNMNEIYEHGHELKGMAANFGLKEVAKIGIEIEKAGQAGDRKRAVAAIQKLPPASERAKTTIREWLKSKSS